MCKKHEGYNGKASYPHWEVSVTIANDEFRYWLARAFAESKGADYGSADAFITELRALGITQTLGGEPFTRETVCAALEEYTGKDS